MRVLAFVGASTYSRLIQVSAGSVAGAQGGGKHLELKEVRMCSKWAKPVMAASALGLLASATTPLHARTVDLTDGSGASIGWSATIPDVGDDASIVLSFVRSDSGTYFFDKTATMTSNDSALVIEFDRTSASAPTLAIGTESITNSTGADWAGFRTFVSTATAAGGTGAGFQLSTASGGFTINPFTNMSFTNNNTEMDVTGGTVANGTAYTPGSAATGGVVIFSGNSADDRFLLKEIGLTGNGGGTAVPLPAAAWMGLSTLLGLGLIGAAKRFRRLA